MKKKITLLLFVISVFIGNNKMDAFRVVNRKAGLYLGVPFFSKYKCCYPYRYAYRYSHRYFYNYYPYSYYYPTYYYVY